MYQDLFVFEEAKVKIMYKHFNKHVQSKARQNIQNLEKNEYFDLVKHLMYILFFLSYHSY